VAGESQDKPPEQQDWVERLTRLAGLVGMNQVQVRWRLRRMQQGWAARKADARTTVEHVTYKHKTCPACGRVNDESARRCAGCGAALGWWSMQVLRRIGLSLPAFLSVSSLLGFALVLVYLRVVLGEGRPDSVFSLRVDTLLAFGGNFAPAIAQGEWWRLACAVFLHAGLWHLGFNLFALTQIGPPIEHIFGRGRMLLFFMATGILASLGSYLVGLRGVGIGASGAIMGLCGVAAGWGQRDGTTIGRNVRNLMFKWAVYTTIFGLVVNADHAAHLTGFGVGFALGFLMRPAHLQRSSHASLRVVEALVGAALALATLVLCLAPPASRAVEDFQRRVQLSEGGNFYAPMLEACDLAARGQRPQALERFRALLPEENQDRLDAATLEGSCHALAARQALCRKFRAGGLTAIYPPESLPQSDYERTQLEREERSTCSFMLDGVPALPEPELEPEDGPHPPTPSPAGRGGG
jgi:rhomboid protease GluP